MSNYTCPECGETNIDSPDGYEKECECLKPDTECLPSSKQIEEGARHKSLGYTVHTFTPDQLKAYREALCREQRELCAEAADDSVQEIGGISEQLWDAIINAEGPR